MENQSFKTQLKQIVKEFLDIDNEIATLQKALKQRKDKNSNLLLVFVNLRSIFYRINSSNIYENFFFRKYKFGIIIF